jgi:hypothetical protein
MIAKIATLSLLFIVLTLAFSNRILKNHLLKPFQDSNLSNQLTSDLTILTAETKTWTKKLPCKVFSMTVRN